MVAAPFREQLQELIIIQELHTGGKTLLQLLLK